MSDYREIPLADAIKRIAYEYGEAHCTNTAAENESTRDDYEPNAGKAYDDLVNDVGDLFANDIADSMTGIDDAISDSQRPAACATCHAVTDEFDGHINDREEFGDLYICPACQDITRHATGLCDDCRENPCWECEHYPA